MKTVILPTAGQGTRLLPLTKSTPKELMPVYDKPVLQFALDEAVECGAERVVVVSHRSKPAIDDYLAKDGETVARLRDKGKEDLAEVLAETGAAKSLDVEIVYQDETLGLGHAILIAQAACLDGPVGVILPDDVILGAPPLCEMAQAYSGGHMVAAMEVGADEVSSYGIFALETVPGPGARAIPARGMVEKPAAQDAPSRLAAVGRYILDASIFDTLKTIPRGAGGEYQLTDAIAADLARIPLTAFLFSGDRHDCGNHEGLLAAANARQLELEAPTNGVTAAE